MQRLFFIILILFSAAALTGCGAEPGEDHEFPRLANLTPFEADSAPRLHEGPVTEFIPGAHGEIFPFPGQFNAGEWGMTSVRYGFFDAYGRIICDPIFDEVVLISYGDQHAFVVSQNGGGAIVRYGLNPSVEGFRAVIPADGSFIAKFDDVFTGDFFFGFNYEFIPVMRDGRWGLIDFSGNQVMPFLHPNAPLFSEGLAAVFEWAGHEHLFLYFTEGEVFNYIDIYGNIVLGPFESPELAAHVEPFALHLEAVKFQDGLALNFRGGRYGFIDTTGRTVIDHNYLFTREFQLRWNDAGLILVALADTMEEVAAAPPERHFAETVITSALMDREGRYVVKMTPGIMHGIHFDGQYYFVRDVNWGPAAMYDLEGNEVSVYGSWHEGNRYFSTRTWDNESGISTVQITGNGVDRTFDDTDEYWFSLQWLFGDWFGVHVHSRQDTATAQSFLWNAQTDEERCGHAVGIIFREPNRNMLMSVNTSWEDRRYGVLDDDANIIIDFVFDWMQPIGENYLVRQGRHGGLLDPYGNWLFRTTIGSNFD